VRVTWKAYCPAPAHGNERTRCGVVATGLALAILCVASHNALGEGCKPRHPLPTVSIKNMGPCAFAAETMSFDGDPKQQTTCLLRSVDQTRNLGPTVENLPDAIANRAGHNAGLPTREDLSGFLSAQNLEWDFAAYLWRPLSRAHDNDPNAPMAHYFVIHDTSGPNFRSRAFPADVDANPKINNLTHFRCSDGWELAHVVVNRAGEMLLGHDFSVPWRATKFERAKEFNGALKGLFVHVELIQPRRHESGLGRANDAQAPTPAFTAAQYDRIALLYIIASVRAEEWLIPAFHVAIDANIPGGHDDPLNFNIEAFAHSIETVMGQVQKPEKLQAQQVP
jgi:hypothetical protein